MKPECGYQFVIELSTDDPPTETVGSHQVTPDLWRPALESGRFAALRRDRRRSAVLPNGPGQIDPRWHALRGEPFVDGFRVTFTLDDGPEISTDFTADYFHDTAQQLGRRLVESGRLKAGEPFRYQVSAFAAADEPAEQRRGLSVTAVPQRLNFQKTPLGTLQNDAVEYGPVSDEDLPAFIPQAVLEETVACLEQAGAAETGGILIGHLHRDPQRPEMFFVEVTAQIPARHAVQELTRLTFTPETWAGVDAALQLRGLGERKLGWWHTHPSRQWCAQCPVENRRRCQLSGEFFSTHDAALHQTCFPMPYSLALVISDSYAHGLTYPLYGWRGGRIVSRGFYQMNAMAVAHESPSTGSTKI